MNKNNNQVYGEDDSIDLIELFSILWLNKKFIVKVSLLFFSIGIAYSLSQKNIYKSSSTFYPHYEKIDNSNNLRSLAGLAGINLSTESSSNIPASLYPKLISSPIFKRKILDEIINFQGFELSYRDHLLANSSSSFNIKELLLFPITFLRNLITNKEDTINNYYSDILNLSNEEYQIHQKLSDKIILNLNEKQGFIELSVYDTNPYVASQIAKIAINILQKSIIDFKIKNINDTYKFISGQVEIAKTNFHILQDSLAKFKDKNKNIKSDIFLNQFSRLESEYNLSRNIYNDLALNKEKIAIDVRKNTPIFTVIKPVVIPNTRYEPQRTRIVLIYSFLGIVIGCFWVLIKNPLYNIISTIRNK
jgi:capsular polysaccharide biosynthesis protein